MATNTMAVRDALIRAMRKIDNDLPETGDVMLAEFKEVVSGPYPPQSAPGSEPHLRTGGYRAGLSVKARSKKITFYAKGFSNNLAIWLEFGTRKMAPRPHWRVHLPRIAAKHVPQRVGRSIVEGESRG